MQNYQFISREEFSNLESPIVTSVHCFVEQDRNFLFTVNSRGIDIIGGHVEANENMIEAMHREALEEASLKIIEMNILGAICIDNRGDENSLQKGYPPIGYQVFFDVQSYELQEFKAQHECLDRVWIPIHEIKETHHHWLECHDQLLNVYNHGFVQNKRSL